MSINNIKLNLNEENELGFKLEIESSTSDIKNIKPKIRFVLSEKNSDSGWIFDTKKSEDDSIIVTIPPMNGAIKESNEYSGKLEVIIGDNYFNPAELNIQFVRPVKVESHFIEKENCSILRAECKLKEENQIIVENNTTETDNNIDKNQQKSKVRYSDLSTEQKKEINKLFVEKCKKLDPDNFKNAKDVMHYLNEGTEYTRERLKALIAKTAIEYLNN